MESETTSTAEVIIKEETTTVIESAALTLHPRGVPVDKLETVIPADPFQPTTVIIESPQGLGGKIKGFFKDVKHSVSGGGTNL